MFDGVLPGVGGFGSGDSVRNVANEGNVFLLGGLSDRKVGIATEQRLYFYEVHAAQDELVNIFVRLYAIGDDKGRFE